MLSCESTAGSTETCLTLQQQQHDHFSLLSNHLGQQQLEQSTLLHAQLEQQHILQMRGQVQHQEEISVLRTQLEQCQPKQEPQVFLPLSHLAFQWWETASPAAPAASPPRVFLSLGVGVGRRVELPHGVAPTKRRRSDRVLDRPSPVQFSLDSTFLRVTQVESPTPPLSIRGSEASIGDEEERGSSSFHSCRSSSGGSSRRNSSLATKVADPLREPHEKEEEAPAGPSETPTAPLQ